ncbi:MAG: hypothetical protein ACTSSJ_02545 [Candidatus Odinarchaeia archaeon]
MNASSNSAAAYELAKKSSELVDGGQVIKGLEMANEIKDIYWKTLALTNIKLIEKLFESGRKQEIIKYLISLFNEADKIQNSSEKFYALISLARGFSRISLKDMASKCVLKAIEISQKFTKPCNADKVNSLLVEGLACAGLIEKGLEFSKKIKDSFELSRAYLHLVKAMIISNKLVDAAKLCEKIKDPVYKSNAYTYIAVYLVNEKRSSDARIIAEYIKDASWKKRILEWAERIEGASDT